jgi:hypothetical protein
MKLLLFSRAVFRSDLGPIVGTIAFISLPVSVIFSIGHRPGRNHAIKDADGIVPYPSHPQICKKLSDKVL